MKNFKYKNVESLEEINNYFNNGDNSAIFAGGTDLLGLIKHEIIDPDQVLNLKGIKNLNKITYKSGSGLTIGALVNIVDIAENPVIREKFAVLSEAASVIGSPQLRNMGTIGGNLCQRPRCWYFREEFDCIRKGGDICYAYLGKNKYHCIIGGGPCYIVHPSDTAVALTALNAEIRIYTNGNIRTIPINEFFVLPDSGHLNENILKPGEMLTEIFIPEPTANTKSKYIKFMERNAWDFAVVSVAAVLKIENGKINSGNLAWGGVAPVPWYDADINLKLKGMLPSHEALESLSADLFTAAEPLEQNKYKIILSKNLTKRIIKQLAAE